MQKLLNCALNFALLLFKLDITQLLVDFNCFSRAVLWQKFWYGRNKDEEHIKKIQIFRFHKYNLPKNFSSPSGLKTMLSSIRSEIMDPRNRNQETPTSPLKKYLLSKNLLHSRERESLQLKLPIKELGFSYLTLRTI